MTLPKKKSRAIEVQGKTFRWMVKNTADEDRVRLTVEHPETGEVKQRTFGPSPGTEVNSLPAVTPGDVKGFIHECWF